MRLRHAVTGLGLATMAVASVALIGADPPREVTLLGALKRIQSGRFVDLTHSFGPGIPHWGGLPDEVRETLYDHEPGRGRLGSGFLIHRYDLAGQWGTHADPPAHFVKGLRTLDQIDIREMILPLVIIDIHEAVGRNPDYTVTIDDVRAWERRHGAIQAGSFVALRTDWSKRWPDAPSMRNLDAAGTSHTPGWSLDVLRYLYEERKITASGHETADTDPGSATTKDDYSLERYILGRDRYQVELLTNLDAVPEFGAIVVVSFPKPRGGSGFPARVFAIAP